MSDSLTVTEQTRLRRAHERGHFDRETIYAILDAMPLCHVGCVMNDKPVVIPTIQWREGNHIYWHGSSASRSLRASENTNVCLTVSILDGFVLARSGFHHSVNYRSVMVFGQPTQIDDPDEKTAKLGNLIDSLYPGRNAGLRAMSAQDAKATALLSLPIEEASAKMRDGGVKDEEEDYGLPIWAGVVPVRQTLGEPIPDPRNLPDVEMPEHVHKISIG